MRKYHQLKVVSERPPQPLTAFDIYMVLASPVFCMALWNSWLKGLEHSRHLREAQRGEGPIRLVVSNDRPNISGGPR